LEKPIDALNDAEKWSLFMVRADNPQRQELMDGLAKSKDEIRLARELLKEMSEDEEERNNWFLDLVAMAIEDKKWREKSAEDDQGTAEDFIVSIDTPYVSSSLEFTGTFGDE
jgi:hypothetical protein